jgi:hypothetical protein
MAQLNADEAEKLVHLVRWLCGVWDNMYSARLEAMSETEPEAVRDYLVFRFPVVQGYKLQAMLREIGRQPVNQDILQEALAIMAASTTDNVPPSDDDYFSHAQCVARLASTTDILPLPEES